MIKERICAIFGVTLLAGGCAEQPLKLDLKNVCPHTDKLSYHFDPDGVLAIGENNYISRGKNGLVRGSKFTYPGEGVNGVNGIYEKEAGSTTVEVGLTEGAVQKWKEIVLDKSIVWVASVTITATNQENLDISVDCRQARY